MLAGSGGTLTEGQNHVLTCTASGGGSMAYTYTWLKNGSVVSGQTSSTYFFSPLLMVHSGRYSCQVSLGSTSIYSGTITITVVCELDVNVKIIITKQKILSLQYPNPSHVFIVKTMYLYRLFDCTH